MTTFIVVKVYSKPRTGISKPRTGIFSPSQEALLYCHNHNHSLSPAYCQLIFAPSSASILLTAAGGIRF